MGSLLNLFELIHSVLNSEKKIQINFKIITTTYGAFGLWIEDQSQQIFLKDFEKFDFIANCTRAL